MAPHERVSQPGTKASGARTSRPRPTTANALAVEHWELSNGPVWDEFFLSGDPAPFTGSAHEFWTRGV